jgi:DNA polymerase II large subunit
MRVSVLAVVIYPIAAAAAAKGRTFVRGRLPPVALAVEEEDTTPYLTSSTPNLEGETPFLSVLNRISRTLEDVQQEEAQQNDDAAMEEGDAAAGDDAAAVEEEADEEVAEDGGDDVVEEEQAEADEAEAQQEEVQGDDQYYNDNAQGADDGNYNYNDGQDDQQQNEQEQVEGEQEEQNGWDEYNNQYKNNQNQNNANNQNWKNQNNDDSGIGIDMRDRVSNKKAQELMMFWLAVVSDALCLGLLVAAMLIISSSKNSSWTQGSRKEPLVLSYNGITT